MTVPDLITRILAQLEGQFYCDQPRRDFMQDQKYLVAAIGTYGWECHQRGWEFNVEFIYGELCRLLTSFKRSGTDVVWMPSYLQNAIRQHIREHAEELSAQAKAARAPVGAKRVLDQVLDGAQLAKVVLEPTQTQLAASIYRDVAKLRRQTAAERRQRTAEERRQVSLL